MTPPRPTVAIAAIVLDADGRVLLVQRGRPPGVGLWTVPGGKLEPGETLAAGVTREVREETGLAVTCGPLVTAIERAGEGYHYVILDFAAALADDAPAAPRAGDDVTDARFVARADLAALPLTDGLVEVLDEALDPARAHPAVTAFWLATARARR